MGKKSGKPGGGRGLGTSIFLVIALLVVLIAGSAVATTFFGGDLVRKDISQDLRRCHTAFVVLQQNRFSSLELRLETINNPGTVSELLTTMAQNGDAEPLRGHVDQLLQNIDADLFLVLDANGQQVAGTGLAAISVSEETDEAAEAAPPPAPGLNLAGDPLLAAVREEKSVVGVWSGEDGLYNAAAAQLIRNFELVGYVVLAARLDDMAAELERTTGAAITLFKTTPTGPEILATSMDSGEAGELVPALRREGQALGQLNRGQVVASADLDINGAPWLAFLAPLRDVGEKPVGSLIAATEVGQKLAVFQQVRMVLLGLGAAALVIGFLASAFIGRRTLAPLGNLAGVATEIAQGNYHAYAPASGGRFGQFGEALNSLAGRLRERSEMDAFFSEVSRGLPEPAPEEVKVEPSTPRVALVAVEMQRFANPKIAFDPEENVSKLNRDIRRISTAVAEHQGKLSSILGHRLLAVFEGDGAAHRAFAAATKVLLILTTRENAFDEPVAPMVGLSSGPVVAGQVGWAGYSSIAHLGVPVQHLESLMREITPGDLYMNKQIATEVAKELNAAQIPIQGQRGLISQQPIYQVKLADAQRFTGATAPTAEPGGYEATKRGLADVTVGEVLGGRYEILAELGNGPMGLTCKAKDRNRSDLVTLKILKPEVRADEDRFNQLRRGISQTRMLTHDNVLSVLDMVEVDGLVVIASQFVRGMSLRYILDQKRPPMAAALILARDIAGALTAAHGAQLAHGGIKPENVIVDIQGSHLMDFGQAGTLAGAAREQPMAGAPYMAPEQIEGREASAESDVFAFGVLLYEMLTGKLPIAGQTPAEVASQRLMDEPEPPTVACPDMPEDLERAIQMCMLANPGERPGADDLFSFLSQ